MFIGYKHNTKQVTNKLNHQSGTDEMLVWFIALISEKIYFNGIDARNNWITCGGRLPNCVLTKRRCRLMMQRRCSEILLRKKTIELILPKLTVVSCLVATSYPPSIPGNRERIRRRLAERILKLVLIERLITNKYVNTYVLCGGRFNMYEPKCRLSIGIYIEDLINKDNVKHDTHCCCSLIVSVIPTH